MDTQYDRKKATMNKYAVSYHNQQVHIKKYHLKKCPKKGCQERIQGGGMGKFWQKEGEKGQNSTFFSKFYQDWYCPPPPPP